VPGITLTMALGALVGGRLGGGLAGRINPERLRWLVAGLGLALALISLLRS
jgi:uncharacterized membrane protein YfcA